MPELPLIGPSNPGISPVPIVRPQNVAGETIARAGGQMSEDATKLFWMQNMARRDEANAFMDNKMGDLLQAHHAIMATATARGLTGDDYSNFYSTEMQATRDQLMQNVPKGFMRDLLQGAMNKQVAESSGEVLQTATMQAVKKAETDTVTAIKRNAQQIPYLDPQSAQQRQIDTHHMIQQMAGWDSSQKQAWDQYFSGQIALHTQNKLVDDAPGHALSSLLNPNWIQQNPEIANIGDPAVIRQQLINRASGAIKDGNREMNAFVAQQQQKDFNTLMQAHVAGQPISSAQLDAMPSLSTGVKRLFKPDYRPQPMGDPAAFNSFMTRAKDVTSSVEGMLLQGEAIQSRAMNPQMMQEFNKQVAASVKENSTAAGAARKQGSLDIENYFNPVAKHYGNTPKLALQKEVAARMKDWFEANTTPDMTPAEIAQKKQEAIKQGEELMTKKKQVPTAEPMPAGVGSPGWATMSDADKAARIRASAGSAGATP